LTCSLKGRKIRGRSKRKWKREVGSVKKNNLNTPEDALNQEIW
jgi:hypothetical protein